MCLHELIKHGNSATHLDTEVEKRPVRCAAGRAGGLGLTSPRPNSRRLSRRRIAPARRGCAAQRQRSVSRAYTAQQRQAARVAAAHRRRHHASRRGALSLDALPTCTHALRTPLAAARAAVAAAHSLTTDARFVAPSRAARRVGGRRRRGRRVVGASGSPRVRQGVLARALRARFVRQPRGHSDARPRANGWPGAHQHLALGGRVRRRRRRRRATV